MMLSKTDKSDTLQPTLQVHATVLYKIFASTTYFLIVIKTYFGAVVCETMRRFDLLRQILVTHVFGLTQIPAEGSGCRWGVAGIPDHDSLWGCVA